MHLLKDLRIFLSIYKVATFNKFLHKNDQRNNQVVDFDSQ